MTCIRCSFSVRESRIKNSSIAIALSPERIGIPTPVLRPAALAAGARGKFGSFVMSSTQAGVFDFQTRPGNPTPRLNSICSVAVLNSFKSVALPAQTESHSSAVRSLFGNQAAPNCHPVFSQTWRRTIFNAAERLAAVATSLVIACSKLSCSSLSLQTSSAL